MLNGNEMIIWKLYTINLQLPHPELCALFTVSVSGKLEQHGVIHYHGTPNYVGPRFGIFSP